MPVAVEYTLAEICDAIELTLGAASGMAQSESYNELHEAEAADDLPMIQVYPQMGVPDSEAWGERLTFQGGVRVMDFDIHVDLYAAVRGELGENMEITTNMIDALIVVLQAAKTKPYFGVGSDAIDAWTWRFRRATFRYSGNLYSGARFVLTIRIM